MGYDKIIDGNGNEIHLNIALHPGGILADELKEKNINKPVMATRLGVYPSQLNDIIKGDRNITANIALKLENETGIAAEFWLGLQMDYDLYMERKKGRLFKCRAGCPLNLV